MSTPRGGKEDRDIRKVHCWALLRPGRGHSWQSSACSVSGVWEGIGEAPGLNGDLTLSNAEPGWLIPLLNTIPMERAQVMSKPVATGAGRGDVNVAMGGV